MPSVRDTFALTGIALIVVGVGVMWWPLALVVLGSIMVGISALTAWAHVVEKRKRGPEDEQEP